MADLVRVFAAEAGTTIGDISHDSGGPPDIVFEVEASASEWAGGELFRVSGFIREYDTGNVDTLGPVNGNLTVTAPWDATRNAEFIFPWPGVNITAAENKVIEIVGTVRVGAAMAGADADIETGMFTFVK